MSVRTRMTGGGLRAFRHRNFRLYWVGQLVSLIGTHMQRAAQAWLVLTLTSDPLMLGLVVTAQYGPILVLGVFGGVVADVLPKRRTIIVTQTIAMALAFILAFLAATGAAEVWHVLLLALFLGIAGVVDMPTRQAFVFEMVGRDDVVSAVALNSTLVNTAKVVGPAVAGLAIAAVGVPFAFLFNGLSFLAVIGGLLAMRPNELAPIAPPARPGTLRAVLDNLAEGLRYVRRTHDVLLALVVIGLVSTVAMNFQVLAAPLARDVLDSDASGYGFLMAASGLGSILAALVLAFGGRPRTTMILVASLALGLLDVALALSRSLPVSLICMAGVGLAGVAMSTNTNTLIQMAVPDALRGRVMAVYVTVWAGSTPVGGLIFGAVASAFGTPVALGLGGIAAIVVALLAGVAAWRWNLLGEGEPVTAEVGERPAPIDPLDLPG